jgi:ABC-type microcin C transport system permease subunit YejB
VAGVPLMARVPQFDKCCSLRLFLLFVSGSFFQIFPFSGRESSTSITPYSVRIMSILGFDLQPQQFSLVSFIR